MLKVSLSAIPMLPMEHISVLLGVLFAHLIEKQVKASKAIIEELEEWDLL